MKIGNLQNLNGSISIRLTPDKWWCISQYLRLEPPQISSHNSRIIAHPHLITNIGRIQAFVRENLQEHFRQMKNRIRAKRL